MPEEIVVIEEISVTIVMREEIVVIGTEIGATGMLLETGIEIETEIGLLIVIVTDIEIETEIGIVIGIETGIEIETEREIQGEKFEIGPLPNHLLVLPAVEVQGRLHAGHDVIL